jgi:hypothetical protein
MSASAIGVHQTDRVDDASRSGPRTVRQVLRVPRAGGVPSKARSMPDAPSIAARTAEETRTDRARPGRLGRPALRWLRGSRLRGRARRRRGRRSARLGNRGAANVVAPISNPHHTASAGSGNVRMYSSPICLTTLPWHRCSASPTLVEVHERGIRCIHDRVVSDVSVLRAQAVLLRSGTGSGEGPAHARRLSGARGIRRRASPRARRHLPWSHSRARDRGANQHHADREDDAVVDAKALSNPSTATIPTRQ